MVHMVDLLEDAKEAASVESIGHGFFLDAILAPFNESAESRARHCTTMSPDSIHHPQGGRGWADVHPVRYPIDGGRVEEVDLFLTHVVKGGEG